MNDSSDSFDVLTHRNEKLFEKITSDLAQQSYSISPNALPKDMADELRACITNVEDAQFSQAGVGRDTQLTHSEKVRGDKIAWITDESKIGKHWLSWAEAMQAYLNRHLFLGLFSFESHFAHYSEGDFYQRHYDAFKGEANRILSLVVYLNPEWFESDGGELLIYEQDSDTQGIKVKPEMGTVVVFLSEEIAHEVLSPTRDRYSIAGWFRVNTSISGKIDPPM